MFTEKLYDEDSYIKNFTATVISCGEIAGGYGTVLDRTAFFPESGGQYADTGKINGVSVSGAHISNGVITHIMDSPLVPGTEVICSVDWEKRFRRMQNHTGEHIVSGIVYKKFGYANVGFHLGDGEMTFDYDGELSAAALSEIEAEANRVCAANLNIKTYYPARDKLEALHYRCKSGIEGDIRIVEIEDCDICACCAPHVRKTGEVGLIKLLDFMRYKGGVRISALCGFDAVDDYSRRCGTEKRISNLLSVPPVKAAEAAEKLFSDLTSAKSEISALKKELITLKAEALPYTDGNRCVFEKNLGGDELRFEANLLAPKTGGITAVFSDNGKGDYSFVCASQKIPLRAKAAEISAALGGKCGGSDTMLFGSSSLPEKETEAYFGKS